MSSRIAIVVVLLIGSFLSPAPAQDIPLNVPPMNVKAAIAPVMEIDGVPVKDSAYDLGNRDKPVAIKNREEAAQYIDADALDKLDKQIDFQNQVLLLFAWRGSGQDKLEVMVMESYPEQLDFNYQPGRTRDLRQHAKLYAVRANVSYPGKEKVVPDTKQYVKVEIRGRFKTGMVAIGGETTGMTVTADGTTLEVDIPEDKAQLRKQVDALDGKAVLIKGSLRVKDGVETGKRIIVTLFSIEETKPEGAEADR